MQNMNMPSNLFLPLACMVFVVAAAGCDPNDGGPPPEGEVLEARLLDVTTDGVLWETKTDFLDDEEDVLNWFEIEATDDFFDEERDALLDAIDALEEDERLVGFVFSSGGCSNTPFRTRGLYLNGTDLSVWVNALHAPKFLGNTCAAAFSETAFFAVRGAEDATGAQAYIVGVNPDLPGPDYPLELNRGE